MLYPYKLISESPRTNSLNQEILINTSKNPNEIIENHNGVIQLYKPVNLWEYILISIGIKLYEVNYYTVLVNSGKDKLIFFLSCNPRIWLWLGVVVGLLYIFWKF